MPKDIREYFVTLGLLPGASLDEIKLAYRRLLLSWHPDHFKPGSVMQLTAEDITKEANEAYEQLCKKKRYLECRPKTQLRKPGPEKRSAPEPWPAPNHQARRAYAGAEGIPREKSGPTSPPPPGSKRANPPRPNRTTAPRPPPAPHRPPPPAPKPAPPPAPTSPPEPMPTRASAAPKEALPRRDPPTPPQTKVFRKAFPWKRQITLVAVAIVMVAFAIREISLSSRPKLSGQPSGASFSESAFSNSVPHVATGASTASVARISDVRGLSFQTPPGARFETFMLAEKESNLWPRNSRGPPSISGLGAPASAFTWRGLESEKLLNDAVALLNTFEVGDSKAKVISTQGTPDEIGDTVLRYGSSLVYFKDGKVTSWSDGQPGLHILALPKFESVALDAFTVGSAKSEVIRIQGLPTDITRNAFYYDASVVYFDREWVTSWIEVDRALRARSMPALNNWDPFADR